MSLKPIVGPIEAQVLNNNFSYINQVAAEAGTDPELEQKVDDLIARIGNNAELNTVEKTKIILALNEVNTKTTNTQQALMSHEAERASQTKLGHIMLQEPWLEATLQNGWTGSIKYAKNDLGIVAIRFKCTSGVVTGLTNITTLPVGYRPAEETPYFLMDPSAGAVGKTNLYIHFDGRIRIAAGSEFLTSKLYQGQILFFAG